MEGRIGRIKKRTHVRKAPLGDYFPTKEEILAKDFCIRKNIRISYTPVERGVKPKNWYIAIILGPYRKGEKWHLSPEYYPRTECQKQMYKACMYYYNKHKANTKNN